MLLMFILLIHFAAPFIYSGKNVDFSVSLGFPKMGVGGGSGQAVSEPDPPPHQVYSPTPLQGGMIPKDRDRGCACASWASRGSQGDPHLLLLGSEARRGPFGNSASG